jgi:GTP-binding protein LepA
MSINIRNFCIIAHIDHGKSTLADRFLELTETFPKNKMKEQVLDQMDLERERGITIKMQPVRMKYEHNEEEYILNLIDTPGHMDFAYEVERSLAAVEGAILLIDATKGVQAQTLANLRLAKDQGLVIIPVLNKIDMPAAQVNEEKIRQEVRDLIGEDNVLAISAKQGTGTEELLRVVIEKIPAPKITRDKPFKALVFDSAYDSYKGIIAYVRVLDGSIKRGERIKLLNANKNTDSIEVGHFIPQLNSQERIEAGEIGYVATGLKVSSLVKVGETLTSASTPDVNPVEGYHESRPLVFADIFPSEMKSFPHLKDNVEKLHLNDFSFEFAPTNHAILGRGFKVGFLGMLHLEIVFERLKREYGTKIILTSPTVIYKTRTRKAGVVEISSAQDLPDPNEIEGIEEPWANIEIITPTQYSSKIHELLKQARGIFKDQKNLSADDLLLFYEAPVAEIIEDFLDNIKSVSQGYASFSYEPSAYKPVDLVKIDYAVVNEVKPSLSKLVHRDRAYRTARDFLLRLKDSLPAQQFPQALQAKIGGKVIAREDIHAARKDVTGALYGGDYSRKAKLLNKQKKGKKKLLAHASVRIPEDVYLKVLKRND